MYHKSEEKMHHATEDKTLHKSSSMMGMHVALGTGVGTSILLLAGFVSIILVIVGIVKSQKIISQSIGNPSKVATMAIMGMVAALLVGLPGVNIVLASIFMHLVRTIDQ